MYYDSFSKQKARVRKNSAQYIALSHLLSRLTHVVQYGKKTTGVHITMRNPKIHLSFQVQQQNIIFLEIPYCI